MDMNKLPPGVREALRERGRKEAEVAIMTPREIFEDYCNWNGIINWSDTLWDTATALMNAQAAPTQRQGERADVAKFSVDEMGFMQLADTKVLSAAARGLVDLNREARETLISRGLDANGQWVGFDKARDLVNRMSFQATSTADGELLELLKHAVARVEIANSEGDEILSAWLAEAKSAIANRQAREQTAAVPKFDGEQRKVVVVLTGGIVDQVLVGEEGVSVAVIDYDKNADLDDLVVIPQTDGTNQYALTGIHEPEVNPARVDELYAAVDEAKPAAEDEDSPRPRP